MAQRVTTLELFFDLVFVFTITQLTTVLVEDVSWTSAGQVASMLGFIWWMYGGYAWLTNQISVQANKVRLVLLGGMAGYLVMALAVPTAYDGAGLTVGIGYLVVNVVHGALFLTGAGESATATMRALTPMNLATAVVVLIGGALGGTPQAVLWVAAPLCQWFLNGRLAMRTAGVDALANFRIGAAHFVERHGLVIIVAIGESVVAVGIGAAGLEIDFKLASTAILALAVSAGLWWAYFGNDDDAAAEEALAAAPEDERQFLALRAFGLPHYVLLFGIVVTACGLKKVIGHAEEELKLAYALALAGGVAVYLVGDAWFRAVLGLGRSGWRAAVGALVLLTVPIGTEVTAGYQLTAVAALLVAMLVVEARKSASSPAPIRHT